MAVEHQGRISEGKRLTSLMAGALGVAALLVWLFNLFVGWNAAAEGPVTTDAGSQLALLLVGLGLLSAAVAMQLPAVIDFLGQRKAFGMLNEGLKIALAFTLVCLVNWLAHRHNPRWDVTSDRLYSVSAEAKALAESVSLDTRLFLITFRRSPDRVVATRDYLDAFAGTNPRFELKTVTNAHTLGRDRAAELMQELERETGADIEGLTIQVGHHDDEGNWKTLRSKSIPWRRLWVGANNPGAAAEFRGEEELGSTLRELVEEEKPRACVLTGHGERSLADFERRGYGYLAKVLREKNYQLDELTLKDEPNADLPEDTSLVLLLGPTLTLEEDEVAGLKRYLDRGGDAILFLEPKVETRFGTPRYVATGLEDYLASAYRIQVLNQTIFQFRSQNEVGPRVCNTKFGEHPIVEGEDPRQGVVWFDTIRPLKVLPSTGACITKALLVAEPLPRMPDFVFASGENEARAAWEDPSKQRGPFDLAAAATRIVELEPEEEGGEPTEVASRLVVVGDVDWGANDMASDPSGRNFDVLLNAVSWAAQRDHEVVGERKRPRSYRLVMPKDTLAFYTLISLFGFPLLSVLLGVVVWRVRSQ